MCGMSCLSRTISRPAVGFFGAQHAAAGVDAEFLGQVVLFDRACVTLPFLRVRPFIELAPGRSSTCPCCTPPSAPGGEDLEGPSGEVFEVRRSPRAPRHSASSARQRQHPQHQRLSARDSKRTNDPCSTTRHHASPPSCPCRHDTGNRTPPSDRRIVPPAVNPLCQVSAGRRSAPRAASRRARASARLRARPRGSAARPGRRRSRRRR